MNEVPELRSRWINCICPYNFCRRKFYLQVHTEKHPWKPEVKLTKLSLQGFKVLNTEDCSMFSVDISHDDAKHMLQFLVLYYFPVISRLYRFYVHLKLSWAQYWKRS